MSTEALEQLHERMLKEFLRINPDVGTAVGLHDPYDRLLPHGGRKRLDDTLTLLEGWNASARRQAASQELSGEDNLHLDLLSMSTDIMRFATDEYPLWKMYPDCLESIGGLLFLMASRAYALPEARARDVTCRLRLIPDHLKQFRTRFDPGEPVRLWTGAAIESCDNFPGLLNFVKETFKDCSHEHRDLADAALALEPSTAEHMEWLKQLLDRSSEDFSMGRDRFAKLLKIRKIEMSVDDILALGRDQLEKLKQERAKLADRIAPGKGVDEAIRISHNTAPKTFERALEETRKEMESAKEFIIKNDIASIDPEAELRVVETPVFLSPMLPYAALSMPSKFDPVQKGEYLVTRPKNSNDLGSHLNEGSIINTAVHEAYPGHFHQGVRSNRKHWMLQLNTMIISSDTFDSGTETCEGWAHYCEKMMFENGYRATDLAALEMVNGSLLRAYRVVADISLACGEASFEDMVELGIKEAGIPRNASEAEVKRYTRTPGQALSYLLGRELLISLRVEMETTLGDDFDEKRFHDLVADYGELPFSLMRDGVKEGLRKH
ncbi:MAG: DUF885 domain-containing protein [Candidatus Thermoplasmatota archaeon]|nr:DUF885 domain-containing protein [Candidatus Thermoplasmatota archaeon]